MWKPLWKPLRMGAVGAVAALLLTSATAVASAPTVQASPLSSYAVTDLGTLPGGNDFSLAYAINSKGQIVGASAFDNVGGAHTFLWQRGVGMHDLGGRPGFDGSNARGINNRGHVVGDNETNDGLHRAYLWQAQHSPRDLGTLGGSSADPFGINNREQVAGWSYTTSGTLHAVLWTPAG